MTRHDTAISIYLNVATKLLVQCYKPQEGGKRCKRIGHMKRALEAATDALAVGRYEYIHLRDFITTISNELTLMMAEDRNVNRLLNISIYKDTVELRRLTWDYYKDE